MVMMIMVMMIMVMMDGMMNRFGGGEIRILLVWIWELLLGSAIRRI